MNFSTLSKTGLAASLLCAALAGGTTGVQAGTLQDTIFAKVDSASANRMFVRLHYINVNVKTTAKDAYDVTGPVLAKGDIDALGAAQGSGEFISSFVIKNTLLEAPWANSVGLFDGANGVFGPNGDAVATGCSSYKFGLGTPCGIKAKGQATAGTLAVSAGYYLNDARDWSAEAFLLAAPVEADVYGDGKNQINGRKIISTKLLPPIVMLSRYFGDSTSALRPFVGLALSYAVFYDTKATATLNDYQGGGTPGDTTVRIKNAFGAGGFLGFKYEPKDSSWSVGFSAGKIRFKTEATLTTNNTTIKDSSAVLKDYGPWFQFAVAGGSRIINSGGGLIAVADNDPVGYKANQEVGVTEALMCDLARFKYGSTSCNMGTYVRKASNVLDNTMLMFHVGRVF